MNLIPKLLKFVNLQNILKSAIHVYDSDNLHVIERKDGLWGIMNKDGEHIVEFGKYDLIEPFFMGLSRVKIGKGTAGLKENYRINKWGIINTRGEEVIPVEYDEIWQFYKKQLTETTLTKDCIHSTISLKNIAPFPYFLDTDCNGRVIDTEYLDQMREDYYDDGYRDAFENDPDAVWNID